MPRRPGLPCTRLTMAIAACLPAVIPSVGLGTAAARAQSGAQSGQAPAQADDGGPVIVGEREQWEGLKLDPIHFAAEFYGRVEQSKVKSATGTRRDVFNEIRGTGSAWTHGYIGHPNFVELNLAGTFGLGQQYIDSDSSNRREDPIETIDEYDVSAIFLRQSDFPTTVYSRRTHDYLTQQFGDTFDNEVSETGIQSVFRDDTFPSSFHYFHRTEKQTARLNPTNFEIAQDTVEWLTTWEPAENQSFTWDYTLDNVTESGDLRPSNDFLRQTANAIHEVNFGDTQQNQLRSSLYGYSETGDNEASRLSLDESLHLRHTPRFETLYDYSFDWSKYREQEQIFQRGSAGLRHKLFESLWTSFDVGGSLLDIPDENSTSNQFFTDILFDYEKKVPLGLLTASLGFGYNFQDDSERGSPLAIRDESYTFPASDIIVIQKQNVTAGSITLTDATGFITYVEGIDYQVQEFVDRVEIRRILGGAINSGQSVLADYEIGPQPAAQTTTWTGSGTLRYDFEESFVRGLGVYLRYLHQDQDRRSKDPDVILPADVDDLTVGADYRIGYLILVAEQQWHDSSLSPYDATRLNAQYHVPLGVGSAIDATASYDLIDRLDENTETTITSVRARWTQRIDKALSFNLSGTWRNEVDNPGSTVDAFEQGLEILWRYRQTSVSASIHNSFLYSDSTDTTHLTMQLGIRREF